MVLLLLLFVVGVILQLTVTGRRKEFEGYELGRGPSKRGTPPFVRDRSPGLEKRGGLFFNDSPLCPKKTRGGGLGTISGVASRWRYFCQKSVPGKNYVTEKTKKPRRRFLFFSCVC